MELLTKKEVFDIDDRIIECSFENPDEIDLNYYIKVWFKYQDGDTIGQGRKEFTALFKLEIINNVKAFFKDKNRGFEIIF